MEMMSDTIQKSRFDTRLSKKQKEYFERAASLGGFKTLSEFVIYSANKQADLIIEKYEAILASEKDKQIFFDAILNSSKPNAALKKAVSTYNEAVSEK